MRLNRLNVVEIILEVIQGWMNQIETLSIHQITGLHVQKAYTSLGTCHISYHYFGMDWSWIHTGLITIGLITHGLSLVDVFKTAFLSLVLCFCLMTGELLF